MDSHLQLAAHKSPAIYSSQNWGLPDGTWRLLFDRARSQFSSVHAVPTQVRDRGFSDDCHGATDRLGMGLVDSAAASILVNGAVDLSVAVTAVASNGDPLQSFQAPAQPLAPLVVQWSNHQDVELPIVATQQVSCESRHIGAELGRSYLRLPREISATGLPTCLQSCACKAPRAQRDCRRKARDFSASEGAPIGILRL